MLNHRIYFTLPEINVHGFIISKFFKFFFKISKFKTTGNTDKKTRRCGMIVTYQSIETELK